MEKYNYNERLIEKLNITSFIEKLNITSFIEKYNFDNELYNTAIFCALSSIESHKLEGDSIESKSLLLGDYFSFEYYSLLVGSLDKLTILTETMQNGYLQLIAKEISVNEFFLSVIKTWFNFYNVEFQESDIKMVTFV